MNTDCVQNAESQPADCAGRLAEIPNPGDLVMLNIHPELTANQLHDQTRAFLKALFETYEDKALTINLRCIAPNKPILNKFIVLTDDGYKTAVNWVHEQAKDYNVYTSVLPRKGKDGTAVGVVQAAYLYVDIDGGTGEQNGAATLLNNFIAKISQRADIAVLTGHGVHAYWKLEQVVPLVSEADRTCFKNTLKRLAKAIGGELPGPHADTACADIARVLRVPGTFNHKTNPPKSVRILWNDPVQQPKSLIWWRAHLPAEPLPFRPQSRFKKHNGSLPPRTLQRLTTPTPPGARHPELVAIAVSAAATGLSEADVLDLLKEKAFRDGFSHDDCQELRDIARWASRRAS